MTLPIVASGITKDCRICGVQASTRNLSDIFGYMMEALVELDEIELPNADFVLLRQFRKGMEPYPLIPAPSGSVPTGMAQLAVAWYMLGMQEPADKCVVIWSPFRTLRRFYGGLRKECPVLSQTRNWMGGKILSGLPPAEIRKNALEEQN